jgi:hypothetical protein
MPWPPRVGELLPRCDEPTGIERKLRGYSLDLAHEEGGPKANGFLVMLGLDITSIDYIEAEIRAGITRTAILKVSPAKVMGFNCTVQFPISGTGSYSHRKANIRTGWELTDPDARPRLTTAFLREARRR